MKDESETVSLFKIHFSWNVVAYILEFNSTQKKKKNPTQN